MASLDRASCQEALSPVITDEVRTVHADLLRRAAFDEAFTALAQALRSCGLDDRSIDLGTGVIGFLEDGELQDQLLDGVRLSDELWR